MAEQFTPDLSLPAKELFPNGGDERELYEAPGETLDNIKLPPEMIEGTPENIWWFTVFRASLRKDPTEIARVLQSGPPPPEPYLNLLAHLFGSPTARWNLGSLGFGQFGKFCRLTAEHIRQEGKRDDSAARIIRNLEEFATESEELADSVDAETPGRLVFEADGTGPRGKRGRPGPKALVIEEYRRRNEAGEADWTALGIGAQARELVRWLETIAELARHIQDGETVNCPEADLDAALEWATHENWWVLAQDSIEQIIREARGPRSCA